MITVDEALNEVLQAVSPLGVEKAGIMDALGRVLGEDIYARRSIPPRDNSAMDGIVLRSIDSRGASPQEPVRLRLVEEIPAGHIPIREIGPFEVSKIMTGAPIPSGGDTVIRLEEIKEDGPDILIFAEAKPGRDIRKSGEDVREGELVIPKGEVIRPAEIGMLASLGYSFLYVYQRPLVAVIATGNELVDIDEAPTSWSIITSNSYSLASQILECRAIPLQMGIARDTREEIRRKFQAAGRADVIISSGGVSVGAYDLVREVIEEAGEGIQFWQVAMRPGKPFAFGRIATKPFFGLPGNPVSAMISFEQFVRPVLLKMMGHRKLFRRMVRARLAEDISKKRGVKNFIRAHVTLEDGVYTAYTTGDQGSGILKSMVKANGLIILPEDVTRVAQGEEVMVQLIDHSLNQVPDISYPGS
ncbi:MAG: gephyrin-like molybdotransferase Glp [Smithellaceae bacterium]|nr:gephyrin-like molybdotransferase Glp [Smithellaceae bacterium]